MASLICATCGTVDEPKKVMKGSFLIELVLWIFLIVPGLLYSLWRLVTPRTKVCRSCGSTNIIPLDSPVGQKLQKELQLGNVVHRPAKDCKRSLFHWIHREQDSTLLPRDKWV